MTRHRLLSIGLLVALGCSSQDAVKLADLRLEALSIAPPIVTQGNNTTVMVSFGVRNDGDGPATSIIVETKLLPVTDGGAPGAEISLGRRSLASLANKATAEQAFSAVIPPAAPPGQYTLLVTVDPDNTIPESAEDNNSITSTAPLTILRRGSNVNFVVSAVTLSAATGSPDDVLTVGYTLRNTGADGILGSTKTEFYLSADTTKSAEDRKIGEHSVGALGAGQMVTLSAMLSIPSDMAQGTYNVLVVANADASVQETDLADNVAGAAYTVGPAITEGIDIVVNAIAVAPTPIPRGGTVTINFTLKNRGNMPTPSFFNRIYLATSQTHSPQVDLVLANVNVSTIPGGETQNFERQITIPNDRSPGVYYVVVSADPTNVVQESNEDNNIRVDSNALIISPPASADVGISGVTLSGLPADGGTQVLIGSSLTVGYTVTNNGPDISGAFSVAIVLSANSIFETTDPVFKTINVPSLTSGESRQLTEVFTIPTDAGGNGRIGVVADPASSQLNDPVRTNNAAFSAEIVSIRNADGGATGGACVEDMYEPNDARDGGVLLTPGMYELGRCGNDDWFTINVPALATLNVDMLILGTPVVDLELGLYAPGGASTIDSSTGIGALEQVGTMAPANGGGDYSLRVYAFSTTRQANYTLNVQVTEAPAGTDLFFTTPPVLTGRTTGGAGDVFNVNVGYRNAGRVAAAASTYEVRAIPLSAPDGGVDGGATVDGGAACTPVETVMGTFPLPAVAGLTTATAGNQVTIPQGMCPGDYTGRVTLDSAGTVAETNEDNNAGTPAARITIASGPVCLDAFEPNNSRAAAPTIVGGTYNALRSCNGEDDFYAVNLAGGEQLRVVLAFVATQGDIELQLQNESGGLLASSNSAGNSETVTYTPAASARVFIRVYNASATVNTYSMTVTGGLGVDLVAQGPSVTPARLAPGDDLNVFFTVANTLTQASAPTTAAVRIVPSSGGSPTLVHTATVPALGGASPDGASKAYSVKFPLPSVPPGTYDLVVAVDPDNSVAESSETNNTLTVASAITVLAPCVPDSLEPNDAAGDARDVTPLDAMTPTVLSSLNLCLGDADWFALDVDPATTMNLVADLTFLQAEGDLDLTLFRRELSGALTQIARSAGNANNERISQTLTEGRYFLRVLGFAGATNPSYGLNVSLAPPGM